MEKIYCIGFKSLIFKDPLFYCFNSKQGAYLSKDINEAYIFNSIKSANYDAGYLMKYFFAYPIEYTIYEGTKKQKNYFQRL